jgi:hypothetical protein
MKTNKKNRNNMKTFRILCEKQDEKNVLNSVKVKKVKVSMFPSKIIIKAIAHRENLRKAKEIGFW